MNQFLIIIAGLSLIQASVCSAMEKSSLSPYHSGMHTVDTTTYTKATGKRLHPKTVHMLSGLIANEYIIQKSKECPIFKNMSFVEKCQRNILISQTNDSRLNDGLSPVGLKGTLLNPYTGLIPVLDMKELDSLVDSKFPKKQ